MTSGGDPKGRLGPQYRVAPPALEADALGVRRRMGQEAHRISAQHRKLDAFHALVAEALARGAAGEARASLQRFQDALEAHFDLEDQFFFPALHGLEPALDAELAQLVREHGHFRRDLEALRQLLEGPDLPGAGRRLAQLAADLATHEAREERLMERIAAGARRGG